MAGLRSRRTAIVIQVASVSVKSCLSGANAPTPLRPRREMTETLAAKAQPFRVHGVDERLKTMIREVAAERRAAIIHRDVMPHPVHVLVSVDPQFGIPRGVRLVKGPS